MSPFTEMMVAAGLRWSDGTRTAQSLEELQRLYMSHGASEVFARIGTRRTRTNADGTDASLAFGLTRARLAAAVGLPLNPELSLFGTYGDIGCQTPPDFSEYPELAIPRPWEMLNIDERAAVIRAWAHLAATEILSTGAHIDVWDLGNEVDFGTAGVAVRPASTSCDGAEGNTTWYQAPDIIDPAIGTKTGAELLLKMSVADRIAWLKAHVWPSTARLLAAAAEGVRLVDPHARFSTHISNPTQSPEVAVAFFEAMADGGYQPDELGTSYYPTSSSVPLGAAFGAVAKALYETFHKPVFVAEIAYASAPMDTGPYTGWDHALPSYPATPQGQYAFLRDLVSWGATGPISGIRPWAPEVALLGWGPMALFHSGPSGTFVANPALAAIADGLAAPSTTAPHD